MLLYVATKNAGKLGELTEILEPAGLTVATFERYNDVVEGEESYAINAALKARALREQLVALGMKAAVLGDDSGLEVEALGGRPGVLSARYGGSAASWSERRASLLAELAEQVSANRRARFVCALHFIDEDGRETAVERDYQGRLAEEERGAGGFSYDAIFISPAHERTFAELPGHEKNRISHRARAAAALLAALALGPDSRSASGKSRTSGT